MPCTDHCRMEFVLLALLVIIELAAIFGWTADSRDSADWKPTNAGRPASCG